MKFNKKLKKGFTLVELIVVIAIVAILAAVSVVSYLAFINQANESADIQLVKQLNVALQADETLNGTRDTMKEMLVGMEAQGFVVENLTKTKSGYDIVWDQENNRFALLNSEDDVIYSEPSFSMNNNNMYTFWKFADTENEASNKKYSVYLTDQFKDVDTLTVGAGLDAGYYAGLTEVKYDNSAENAIAQINVILNTNGGKLTINGPKDTVKHYGNAESINIVKVASASYHEFGTVPFIQISQGRIVIEPTGDVNGIHVANVQTVAEDGIITKTPNAFSNDVVLTLNGKDVKLTRDTVGTDIKNPVLVCEVQANANSDEYIWLVGDGTIENGKVYVTETNEAPDTSVESTTTTDNASAAAIAIANNATNTGTEEEPVWTAEEAGKAADEAQAESALKGSGTETDPYLINNLKDFQNCEAITEKATQIIYFKVMEDFVDDDPNWITWLYYADIDLNGHTITLGTPHTFFRIINDVKVHNGTINWDGGTALCNLPQAETSNVKATFENLNLKGKIITTNAHFGPIISYLYAAAYKGTYEINANNINNTLTIIDQNGDVGGLFGYVQGNKITVSVTDCTFAGSAQGSNVGGFLNCCSYPEAKPIVNSGNSVTGKLTASGTVRAFGLNGNYDPYKSDGTKDSDAAQNSLVDATSGSLVKLSASTTLLSIDSSTKEISVTSVDGASYYIVEIEYWVTRNSDGSGGYPRTIQVRLNEAGNSGLKQLDFVQTDTEPSSSVTLLNYGAAKVWEENGVYNIFDPYYTMYHSTSNWYVRAYAYDTNDTLKAYQTINR